MFRGPGLAKEVAQISLDRFVSCLACHLSDLCLLDGSVSVADNIKETYDLYVSL